jgi:hypothetical protein
MATLDWPATEAFRPTGVKWGARTTSSGWQGFYTGQSQRVAHLGDRMRCTIYLPPVLRPDLAGHREAFLEEVASAGHWLRLWHFARDVPAGTMRGAPALAAVALAAARQLTVAATPGATLLGGDMLGCGSVLLKVAAAGALADGGGTMVVPLVLPCPLELASGTPVTWLRPTGNFELLQSDRFADYGAARLQGPMQLELLQVVPT